MYSATLSTSGFVHTVPPIVPFHAETSCPRNASNAIYLRALAATRSRIVVPELYPNLSVVSVAEGFLIRGSDSRVLLRGEKIIMQYLIGNRRLILLFKKCKYRISLYFSNRF